MMQIDQGVALAFGSRLVAWSRQGLELFGDPLQGPFNGNQRRGHSEQTATYRPRGHPIQKEAGALADHR